MTSPGTQQAALVWVPFDTTNNAMAVAETLLEEGLIACANIVPQMQSVFRYEGKVQSSAEVGVLFKTRADVLDAVTARLAELHPYDTPAICGWAADSAPPETLDWLAGSLSETGKR